MGGTTPLDPKPVLKEKSRLHEQALFAHVGLSLVNHKVFDKLRGLACSQRCVKKHRAKLQKNVS